MTWGADPAKWPCHGGGLKPIAAIVCACIAGISRGDCRLFLTNRAVAPTNNESERALRPCVTFRKITGGFRTAWGTDLYADIRSVLETARRRGIPPLQAIVLTPQGHPLPLRPA